MARKKERTQRVSTTAPRGASMGSLGDLLRGAGLHDGGTAPQPAAAEPSPTPERGRLLLRRERKGRAGKTVTIVEGLALRPDALRSLCRQLRKALGCGASVEGQTLVLQGDQRSAAATSLAREGWQVRTG